MRLSWNRQDPVRSCQRLYGSRTGASLVQGWAGTTSKFYTEVSVQTLDAVLNGRIDGSSLLVKLDVEGFENEVLSGAERTLSLNPRPIWLVEICLDEHFPGGFNENFQKTFDVFWRHGYRASVASLDQRVVMPQDVNRWVRNRRVDFGSHNYIFS